MKERYLKGRRQEFKNKSYPFGLFLNTNMSRSWPLGGLMQLVAYGAQDIYMGDEGGDAAGSRPIARNQPSRVMPNPVPIFKKKEVHRALKTKKFKNLKENKYKTEECCICLEMLQGDDYIVIWKCEHFYHKECDSETTIKSCPMCRSS